ncbi:hypothetical protein BDR26DRAFT_319812 [Obelidium mucronatum]|nr:hypothetical protein BDR26DRAFT_319812 [Obelidium mucronatum]
MSRGRGGFRGGGRGGGFGNNNGMDVDGLDVSFHDIPLFPEMKLPPVFKKVLENESELLEIDKKWSADFKDSPFYLEPAPVRDDVERYSDRFKSWSRPKTKSLVTIPTDLKYFPDELHQVKDATKRSSMNPV